MKSMIRYLKPTKHQRRLSLLEPPSSYPPYFYFKVVLTVGLTIHLYMLTHFTMSQVSYGKLPDAYRKAIEELAPKAAMVGTEKGKEFDEKLLKDMQTKYGIKVAIVQKPAFVQKVAPLHDELAAAAKGSDILAMIREIK